MTKQKEDTMKREQIEEKIIKIIVLELLQNEGKIDEIDKNSKFYDEIEIDSISVIDLLVLIEENFDIEIEDVTEFTDSLTDINGLVEFIYKKQNDDL